jgi:hypothetical protein
VTGGLPLLTKAPAGFLPIWFGLVWPAGIWRLAQLIMRKSPSPGPSPLRGRGETGSLLPLSRARERGLSLLVLAVQVGLLVRVWPYPIA